MEPVSLVLAVGFDFLLGDPRWLPHPVRWIGSLIMVLERYMYPKKKSFQKEFITGALLCFMVVGITIGCGYLFLFLCGKISPVALIAGQIIIAFYCISAKSLGQEGITIYKFLKNNDIQSARKKVSMIVGRDTESLDEHGISRATVETIAENITDGIISPLIYLAAGGPIAALAFKAVSTMDSMIGYKNERYRYFGTCAAKLDDVLNFIPARITGYVIIPLIALILRKNALNSLRIVHRDRLKHPSPNSAHGEAAIAGAMGIKLGGESTYEGKVSAKPFLNEEGRSVNYCDIKSTVGMAYGAAVVIMIFLLCVMAVVNKRWW